jgi:hypothetical protein
MYTAPAYLPPKTAGWPLFCAACYRAVLEREPPAESAVREWTERQRHRP